MQTLIFNIEKKLTEEIIILRMTDFFNNEFSSEKVIDEFDDSAFFSTLRFNGTLIGVARITETSVISVFDKWSKGKDSTPKGQKCYEITRTVVKKEWRRRAMYHGLAMFTLKYLQENNAKTINTILERTSNVHDFLLRLGSVQCGEPYLCYDAPLLPSVTQAYTLNLLSAEYLQRYQIENNRIMNAITNRGYQII
jgi:predicted GNAT family N-acyltransferase